MRSQNPHPYRKERGKSGAPARIPLCDQTATHLSRKARERWGTHCMSGSSEGSVTGPLAAPLPVLEIETIPCFNDLILHPRGIEV